jgi:protein SCO1/2
VIARAPLAAVAAALLAAAAPARAFFPPNAPPPRPADPVDVTAPEAVQAVDVVERLGEQVPLDLAFTGADGRPVALRDVLARGKPTVLALVYYECPMLCGLVLGGLSTALRQTGLGFGSDFVALTVSFDPRETSRLAAERQRTYLSRAGATDRAADWPFLTGQEPEIRALADAVGFRYAWDPETKQYAHAAVVVVLTPEGRVSRYLYGVDYPARDVRLGIVEAAEGRVGTAFDRLMLTCFRYDPASRRYAPYVIGFIKAASAAVLGALAVTLGVYWRREWKASRREGGR